MCTVCWASISGQFECGNYNVSKLKEDYSLCGPGYMLENITNGTCENAGSGSVGLPSCVPLNCSQDNLPLPANVTTVLQLPSCGLAYQSQCTVSCKEGFTGNNVTYLCNVTSDPTIVNWTVIHGTESNHNCTRGVLLYTSHN